SSVAGNGDVQTGLTRDDLAGMRYLATNGAVTSHEIAGGALQWGSFEGATNPGVAGYKLNVSGANTYGGSTVVNAGTLSVAQTGTPATGDGLLTSGLRKPARVAGIAQAETPNSEIALPRISALMDVGVTDENGGEVTRGKVAN